MDDTDAFCTNETSMFMNNYIDRLKTFEHWSPQIQPNKYQLASCGLYYLGQHDRCKCFVVALCCIIGNPQTMLSWNTINIHRIASFCEWWVQEQDY